MKLKIKKEIIENKELSHNAILAYVGIIACYRYEFDKVFINKNMINYYLTNNTIMPKRFEGNLRDGIRELLDKDIIECYKKNATDYYLNLKNIKLEEDDKFVFIDLEDIQKIMTYKYQGKIPILRFYICLLGTFLSKNSVHDTRDPNKFNNVIGMMSQEYLANLIGISKSSAIEYIKILENLKIIYIYRCHLMFRDAYGNIKKHNNVYGKYKDKDIINDFVKIKYSMYDDLHRVQTEKVINSYRSLMQKYNCLCNGTKYNEKTIEDIFKHVVDYNNKHPKNEKDLTIFKQYGYVID